MAQCIRRSKAKRIHSTQEPSSRVEIKLVNMTIVVFCMREKVLMAIMLTFAEETILLLN